VSLEPDTVATGPPAVVIDVGGDDLIPSCPKETFTTRLVV
jgi:hypothetical protein